MEERERGEMGTAAKVNNGHEKRREALLSSREREREIERKRERERERERRRERWKETVSEFRKSIAISQFPKKGN